MRLEHVRGRVGGRGGGGLRALSLRGVGQVSKNIFD